MSAWWDAARVGTVALTVIATLAPAAVAAPGDPETEFGGDGTVTIDVAGRSDSGQGLAVQSDGKLLVAGFSGVSPTAGDYAVTRVLADGTPDPSFDGDGHALADFGTVSEGAWAVTVDGQGRVLLAGSAGADSFGLARFTAAGALDSSLAGDGTRMGDFGGLGSSARAVVMYPGGAIGVIGHNRTAGNYDFAAARLLDNGDYDNSFAGDGKAVVDLGTDFDVGSAAVLQSDGKLVIGGVTGSPGFDCGAARLTDAGLPDAGAFGGPGFVLRDAGGNDYCDGLALDGTGRILLGGRTESTESNWLVARLTADGAFDPTFAGTGLLAGALPGYDSLTDVALSPDGKIVAAGSMPGPIDDFLVLRLNPDGTLDQTFSGDGVATASFGVDAYASNVEILRDGDVVVSGATYPADPAAGDIALARFDGGPLTVDLTAKGKQRVGKLRAALTCSLPCQVSARGKGRAGGDKFKTKAVSASAEAGQQVPLRLKLKRRDRRELKGEKGKVKIAASVVGGELSASDSAKVKLKR
jgi:uncharacterized delta-60 repeat protein